jgi:hypothetical protein
MLKAIILLLGLAAAVHCTDRREGLSITLRDESTTPTSNYQIEIDERAQNIMVAHDSEEEPELWENTPFNDEYRTDAKLAVIHREKGLVVFAVRSGQRVIAGSDERFWTFSLNLHPRAPHTTFYNFHLKQIIDIDIYKLIPSTAKFYPDNYVVTGSKGPRHQNGNIIDSLQLVEDCSDTNASQIYFRALRLKAGMYGVVDLRYTTWECQSQTFVLRYGVTIPKCMMLDAPISIMNPESCKITLVFAEGESLWGYEVRKPWGNPHLSSIRMKRPLPMKQ